MEKIYMKAKAKINLNLIVLDKRKDGYHNIKSIFQRISLYDEIYVRKTKTNDFEIKTNIEELNNKENIIYKAYIKLREKYEKIKGIQVILNKRIPMQAGLAGGSADCASFILCMNKLFDLKLSKGEIELMGRGLGADVVPCLYEKATLVEGVGDIVTGLDTNFKYYIVIIKPEINCNTSEMYKKFDEISVRNQMDTTSNIIKGLKNEDLTLVAKNLYNSFEYVVNEKDVIDNIKNELIENGAIGSLMTGSGSCVYGIFKDKEIAKRAYKLLKQKYQTYICTT